VTSPFDAASLFYSSLLPNTSPPPAPRPLLNDLILDQTRELSIDLEEEEQQGFEVYKELLLSKPRKKMSL
jgi:hypothetical protein